MSVFEGPYLRNEATYGIFDPQNLLSRTTDPVEFDMLASFRDHLEG